MGRHQSSLGAMVVVLTVYGGGVWTIRLGSAMACPGEGRVPAVLSKPCKRKRRFARGVVLLCRVWKIQGRGPGDTADTV